MCQVISAEELHKKDFKKVSFLFVISALNQDKLKPNFNVFIHLIYFTDFQIKFILLFSFNLQNLHLNKKSLPFYKIQQ
jgi:hypothetical protein